MPLLRETALRRTPSLRLERSQTGPAVFCRTGQKSETLKGEREVKVIIDTADFAVGQSRGLAGMTMRIERPDHRMCEQGHPLGPVGVITAFNFAVAIWSWNLLIALVAGDTVIWKPSSEAILTAIATMKTIWPVLERNELPPGTLSLVIGNRAEVGDTLIRDRRIALISATDRIRMPVPVRPGW